MSSEAIARIYQKRIDLIVKKAEEWGISVSVTREPLQPLAMGHARHVVETWPARRKPEPPAPRVGRPDRNHGWVTPRADGAVAKCGGPAICVDCMAEQQAKQPPSMDPADHGTEVGMQRVTPLPHKAIMVSTPRPMSDREWAAQPANLREGCTKHAPGVGDL